ncbi:cyclic lactone autoinducer peptide [Paenibacillus validus]|uniref:Cyclic lactone autoinducer peptide n=1 Tax=Paenibacillus validus TaxID=44253 RepID=A0A7X2ZAR4_9BACL|nr:MULTISPECIES: cyclic lactone autoinducer peptide [Paenibacillus]MED4602526.1 cyclic lactone autoinducer peptide [Paenibacillus validus]MED4607843.1 cyclic lactone autoinducer peptide [Paenibacillus validus]MUG71474.1 cyclic lactone autoinducer peptide [Paenibacillus validus]
MKKMIAFLANGVLVFIAATLMGTNSFWSHRPATPTELLKK